MTEQKLLRRLRNKRIKTVRIKENSGNRYMHMYCLTEHRNVKSGASSTIIIL